MKAFIFLVVTTLVGQEFARAMSIPESDIDSKFIRIGSIDEYQGGRSKRAADRGAQNVYYISRNTAVWGDAWFECRQAMNGEVISIETVAEDIFIRDFLIKHGIDTVWTSGAYDSNLGIWRWLSTGGEASYLNWAAGQPIANDPSQRIQFKNSLFNYGWSVAPISTQNHYICGATGEPVPQPTPTPPPTVPPPPPTTTVPA